MGNMQRGLDLPKAQAALKRAAEKAMHGTREERSGRFVLKRTQASGAVKPASRRTARKDRA
jgi:hypothetical protein